MFSRQDLRGYSKAGDFCLRGFGEVEESRREPVAGTSAGDAGELVLRADS